MIRLKTNKLIGMLLLLVLLVVGCSSTKSINYDAIDNNLNAGSIKLSMNEKEVLESMDEKYTTAPCVLGDEYIFEKSKLDVVFNTDSKQIVRLTTKNETSTLYDIKIGDKVNALSSILLKDGYKAEDNSKYKFIKDNFRITILSKVGTTIDGYTIDVLEEEK